MKASSFSRQLAVAAAIACAVAIGATSARAQVTAGTYTYAFTTSNVPLWDVSGTYAFSGSTNTTKYNASADATFVISNAASGKILGTETETITGTFYYKGTGYGFDLTVDGTLSGKISAKKGTEVASLSSSGTISGTASGKATGKSVATIEPSTLEVVLAGTDKLSFKYSKKSISVGFPFEVTDSLPAGMTGNWTLQNDITTGGDSPAGTATLTLSNGRAFAYNITGSVRGDVAKLKLVGTGDAAGTSISMTTTGSVMDVTVLKGKVLGQKLALPVVTK
jgi:hypothetical protein